MDLLCCEPLLFLRNVVPSSETLFQLLLGVVAPGARKDGEIGEEGGTDFKVCEGSGVDELFFPEVEVLTFLLGSAVLISYFNPTTNHWERQGSLGYAHPWRLLPCMQTNIGTVSRPVPWNGYSLYLVP